MIEIARRVSRGPIGAVLFDFDGTLSLIREGWQEVMISMMIEVLQPLSLDQPQDELRTSIRDYVTRLTGKQTIYQMIRLAEEVKARGGVPEDPVTYKHRYHHLLDRRIKDRIEGLQTGRYAPEAWLVNGSMEILEELSRRRVPVYLASGTDEVFVRQEARLLGLTRFFGERIYGALDQYRLFSKRAVIDRVLSQCSLGGSRLVAFGDGYVEIENTKEVGGTAVGVASEERVRSGVVDEWKRRRLLAAGADLIVPDFSQATLLVSYLMGEIDLASSQGSPPTKTERERDGSLRR
jgi:phosphoglycolate phosphatase